MKPQSPGVLCPSFLVVALSLPGTAHAASFRVMHNFKDKNDGANPLGGLMEDSAGNIYGTTIQGGVRENGTIFKVAKDGKFSVLHSFAGGSDGSKPESAVISDSAGNFYGTTSLGGSNCDCGTVYKLAPDGTETILHVFTGGNDGAQPYAALVADKSGNLYGTTVIGGADSEGTVFKIAADGTEKVLHTFTGGNDGEQPYAGLIPDKNGNLFGTAIGGGAHGFGVVYELTAKGTFKVPYAFTGRSQAAYPEGSLLADKSGNFYGTTRGGGTGSGTVYKLSVDFHEKVLYAFTGGSDGSEPYAGVAADKSGNLYGAAVGGGAPGGFGTVFKVAPTGVFTLLHAFTGGTDGAYPEGGVITSNSHKLFGVAYAGGPLWGTVFKLPR